MDLHTLLPIITSVALVLTGAWCGVNFLRLGNQLLGLEWLILALSAFNAIIYLVLGSTTAFGITMFWDAFSRTIGIPVIGGLGILAVTADLKLSGSTKIALFALGGVIAAVIRIVPRVEAALPALGLAFSVLLTIVLIHMVVRLVQSGLKHHALLLSLATLALVVVGVLDGLAELPNPTNNPLLDFWFYSNLVWALAFAEIYFAYAALVAFVRSLPRCAPDPGVRQLHRATVRLARSE